MAEIILHDDERIDDLQLADLHIIQSENAFRFSMDSVLLADFASLHNRALVCDLGTGTGIIPLLLYGRNNTIICDAIEIQPDAAERAGRSILLNNAQAHIRIINGDLRQVRKLLSHGKYSLVTCNPPYTAIDASIPSPKAAIRGARQEDTCTFDDVASAANWLLKDHGKFAFMLPANRLCEITQTLRSYRLEIKRLRFVHSMIDRNARLMLAEAMKGVSPGVEVLPPLIIHNADGTETTELKRIYHQEVK